MLFLLSHHGIIQIISSYLFEYDFRDFSPQNIETVREPL